MNDYSFGYYLFELRTKVGISQTVLANQVGVTNKAVSRWEVGKAKPSVETIIKLATPYSI